jgi:2'-5' RNA ligase
VADGRRLFFALWPDAGLQGAITESARAVARGRAIGGRETPAERVHLTLLFLGDVSAKDETRVITAAGRISARPFDLTLDQAGCFFRSKAFWLGASVAPRKLAELAEALRAAMAGIGLAPDRKDLVPHVTCLRDIKHRIRPVPVAPIRWPVRSFALVHSAQEPREKAAHPLFEGGARGQGAMGGKSVRPFLPAYHLVSQWPLQNAPVRNVKTVQSGKVPE